MNKLQILAAVAALSSVGICAAHPIHDGEELGATVRYIPGTDIQVRVTLKPKVSFERVTVELGSNSIGGARIVCELGSVVAGQSYECLVAGDVPVNDPGLIINIIGREAADPLDPGTSRKSFSVANPNYDRVTDQRLQREARDRASRNTTFGPPRHRD